MIEILFATDKEKLIPVDKPVLASGDVKTVSITVEFDGSWDGYGKSAVFFRKGEPDVYEAVMQEGNTCEVPHEVLDKPGFIIIGVRGVKDDKVYTSTLVSYKVENGAPEGTGESVPPTPDVYQQILSNYGNAIQAINQEKSDREKAIAKEVADREKAIAKEVADRESDVDGIEAKVYEVKERVPFGFGIDVDNNYGFIPEGSDKVIPFNPSGLEEVHSGMVTGGSNPLSITIINKGKAIIDLTLQKNAPETYTYTYTIKKNGTEVKSEQIGGAVGLYTKIVEVNVEKDDIIMIESSEVGNLNIAVTLYVTGVTVGGEPVYNEVLSRLQEVEDEARESSETVAGFQGELTELKSDIGDLNSEVFGEIIETDVTGELLTGTIIDTRTGAESTKFQYSTCTDFIDVSDNADYHYTGKIFNYIGIAGYNSNDEFVTSVLSDTNEVFTDYKLTIPDGVSKIRASSYNPSATSINPLQVFKKAKTSNLVDEVSALNKNKENITIVNHIYVATTGSDTLGDGTLSNPFASIYHANENITDATETNQYIIHVADGIYTDLQTRYAGVQTHENYEGIKCKPWVIYEGNVKHPENVVIQWDGKTGYSDEFNYNDHAVHFCPFHITGSNGWTTGHKEIRGFTFDCKNTRYALHVEMSGYGYGVTWKVSDCIFIWHGVPDCSDITYQLPTIGTGSGHYEKGHLLRCKIINDSGVTDGFRNHDSRWVYGSLLGNLPHIGAEIIIEDCVFNGGDSGDTNIMFRTIYGNGLVDGYNRFSIINCVGINKLVYGLSGGSTECEWRANIKCSKIVTNQFSNEGLLQ